MLNLKLLNSILLPLKTRLSSIIRKLNLSVFLCLHYEASHFPSYIQLRTFKSPQIHRLRSSCNDINKGAK
jgi:hypothetical protein